jgi:hypothetical protein
VACFEDQISPHFLRITLFQKKLNKVYRIIVYGKGNSHLKAQAKEKMQHMVLAFVVWLGW